MTLILICAAYLIAVLLARYFWVVLPNNHYLREYACEIEGQFQMEQEHPQQLNEREKSVRKEVDRLLGKIREIIPENCKMRRWLIRGTGRQLAAWRLAHRAKCLVIDILSPDVLIVKALVASEELKQLGSPEAKILAEKIQQALDQDDKEAGYARLKLLLIKSYELLFDARDTYYETLADWQNKAMWLVMVGLSILLMLGLGIGNAILLILGAVGGLLARMQKVLERKNIGFDYGMSWSTLFLSPLVGALTGWAGVILVYFLVDIGLLGDLLKPLQDAPWSGAHQSSVAMALAVTFGFSANLFNRMIEQVAGNLTKIPKIGVDKATKT